MEVTAYKKDGMYIPIKQISAKVANKLIEAHRHRFYEERACKKCENLPDRHNDLCDQCPAFTDEFKLAKKVVVKDNKYLRLPIGSFVRDIGRLEAAGYTVTVKSKVPSVPVKKSFKFTGTLKPLQQDAMDKALKVRRGILQAPPRFGKTVLGSAIACALQRKTLFLASQRDWLKGFLETFIGSKTQPALTNLKASQIKLCKTYEDFAAADIALATVQTFHSDAGQVLLKRISSMFEVVMVDEVHLGAATKFLGILAKFNARYFITLSATPFRKDRKEVLLHEVVGKVFHKVEVEQVQPQVRFVMTKYRKDYKGRVLWPRMVSSLENDKARLKLIAQWALKDVENGHMILIPFAQTKPIAKLVQMINEMAGEDIAHAFTGKEAKIRDELIQKARTYKLKILVGQFKILSTGINIPRASMLYEVTMSSNMTNAEQRMRRVCTPFEGKPTPCIRFFLDDMPVRRNCLRNEWFNVVMKIIKPAMSEKTKIAMETYFKQRGTGSGRLEI